MNLDHHRTLHTLEVCTYLDLRMMDQLVSSLRRIQLNERRRRPSREMNEKVQSYLPLEFAVVEIVESVVDSMRWEYVAMTYSTGRVLSEEKKR